MIKGLNHITFSVRNLDTSFEFYTSVLGFNPLMRNAKSAYFLAGNLWFCIEEEPAFTPMPATDYTHTAFSVDQNDFSKFSDKIIQSGVKIFKENKSEGDSLYFLDPDGHKLEIHAGNWQSRIDAYKKHNQSSMTFF